MLQGFLYSVSTIARRLNHQLVPVRCSSGCCAYFLNRVYSVCSRSPQTTTSFVPCVRWNRSRSSARRVFEYSTVCARTFPFCCAFRLVVCTHHIMHTCFYMSGCFCWGQSSCRARFTRLRIHHPQAK